jgi:hypothetical protein
MHVVKTDLEVGGWDVEDKEQHRLTAIAHTHSLQQGAYNTLAHRQKERYTQRTQKEVGMRGGGGYVHAYMNGF